MTDVNTLNNNGEEEGDFTGGIVFLTLAGLFLIGLYMWSRQAKAVEKFEACTLAQGFYQTTTTEKFDCYKLL